MSPLFDARIYLAFPSSVHFVLIPQFLRNGRMVGHSLFIGKLQTFLRIPLYRISSPSASSSNGGHFCRVCLESEDIGVLLKPCSCRGTSAYCHTSCLQQWLRIKTKESPDSAEDILRCGVCKERFNVKITYEQRDRRIISQICKQKKDVLKGADVSRQSYLNRDDFLSRRNFISTRL